MDDECLGFLSRHMVVLSWIHEPHESGNVPAISGRRPVSVPAIVISWRDTWFLLTAGHILDDIEKNLAEGHKIISSQLWDGHVLGASNFRQIPFDLERSVRYSASRTIGYDIGLIMIRPYYRKLLEANGVTAFVESTWTAVPDDLTSHLMIGLPTLFQTKYEKAPGLIYGVGIDIVALPVRTAQAVPSCLHSDKPRFYGKLDDVLVSQDGKELTDIDGMSGGPIMGFKKCDNGQMRYWLVAIQSGWAPQSRVISAVPMYILEQMFLEAEAVTMQHCAVG